MSLSTATENHVLKMLLQGVDPSWRAGTTQYLALVTGVSVNEATPIANECTYTGYSRVALTKATAWSDNGSNFKNASIIQFGKRTDSGATQTASHAVLVDTASGDVNMAIIAQCLSPIDISMNVQPQFDIGDLTISAN